MILQIKGTTSIKLSKMDAMMQTTKSKKTKQNKTKTTNKEKEQTEQNCPFYKHCKIKPMYQILTIKYLYLITTVFINLQNFAILRPKA